MSKNFPKEFIITMFSIVIYCLSVALFSFDVEKQYRWIIFFLHVTSVFTLPGYLIFLRIKQVKFSRLSLLFLLVVLLAVVTRLYLLQSYPYTTIGDELRDGGLDAVSIFNGQQKDIFNYGNYQGYGLIIPTIVSFFVPLFGNSSLLYRFPAALVSITDILLIYYLVKKRISQRAGFLAAFILINLPLHLFWGRTEIVVAFDSLITTMVILLVDWFAHTKPNTWKIVVLGLLFGFFSGFHTGARTVVLLGIIAVSFILWRRTKKEEQNGIKRGDFIQWCLLIIGFWVIGFGPRIFYSPPRVLLQARSINVVWQVQNNEYKTKTIPGKIRVATKEIQNTSEKYVKTFMIYGYEKTDGSHYPDKSPLLPFGLFVFFIIGLIYSITIPSKTGWIVVFFVFLLPLTNSAITETPYLEHRLASLLPVAAIIAAMGVRVIVKRISSAKLKKMFIAMILVYITFGTIYFFKGEPANRGRALREYMVMYLKNNLIQNPPRTTDGNLCVLASKDMSDYLQTIQIREFFNFYLPKLTITSQDDAAIKDNQLFVSHDCRKSSQFRKTIIHCSRNIAYYCPNKNSRTENDFKESDIEIVMQKDLL